MLWFEDSSIIRHEKREDPKDLRRILMDSSRPPGSSIAL